MGQWERSKPKNHRFCLFFLLPSGFIKPTTENNRNPMFAWLKIPCLKKMFGDNLDSKWSVDLQGLSLSLSPCKQKQQTYVYTYIPRSSRYIQFLPFGWCFQKAQFLHTLGRSRYIWYTVNSYFNGQTCVTWKGSMAIATPTSLDGHDGPLN